MILVSCTWGMSEGWRTRISMMGDIPGGFREGEGRFAGCGGSGGFAGDIS